MPLIEVSNGELADKWTILQIKRQQLQDSQQIKNVIAELSVLEVFIKDLMKSPKTSSLISQLEVVNAEIWEMMEALYKLEDHSNTRYLDLTIQITKWNQKRAFVKKAIDSSSNSHITEAKSFFENPEYVIQSEVNEG